MPRPLPTAHLACWLPLPLKLTHPDLKAGSPTWVPDLATHLPGKSALPSRSRPIFLLFDYFLTTCSPGPSPGQGDGFFLDPKPAFSFIHNLFFH